MSNPIIKISHLPKITHSPNLSPNYHIKNIKRKTPKQSSPIPFLSDASLFGPFPVVLCRLPSLAKLSLSYNYINDSLPPSISACRSLVYLDLSENLLVGNIPDSLSDLLFLRGYASIEFPGSPVSKTG
ncbi:hypothetical protein CASFOL_041946 [Castilleja foliolosa]|uniref:Uncharacterized protein n=1 Tax=Castilleja foliolosa TaxID=1961234 RepID=A0ABD3B961_9LAMI